MWRSRRAVVDAAMAEVAPVLRAAHGDLERLAPVALGRERVEDRARLGRFALRARLILGVGIAEALLDLKLGRGVLPRVDDDGLADDALAAVLVRERHVDGMIAGPRVEVHTEERVPAIAVQDERHVMSAPKHRDTRQAGLRRKAHLEGLALP